MNRVVRIDLAYDGSGFHGWQIQPRLRTVQGDLSAMVTRLLGRDVKPTGAGRTDTGVHALGQVAHLGGVSVEEIERLRRALWRVAPDDIEILEVREVSPDFGARFSAIWRRYEYRMRFGRNIFSRGREWQLYSTLDRAAMDAGAAGFLGERDFSSFCKTASLKENNVCDLQDCRFEWSDDSAIFHVRANRFLHHMVRVMVGTLVELGEGLRQAGDIVDILAKRDRAFAGKMAPAHGLYLAEVGYPQVLSDPRYKCREPSSEESV